MPRNEFDNYKYDFSLGEKEVLTPEDLDYIKKCKEESERILAELKASGFNQPNKKNRK